MSDMEVVKVFNSELNSLFEAKPPVSRAKMASITKCALKAVKFYKHVVQSVEKFIQKCRPEYKLSGLYVIDSIVRQSRHQFGPEKDVYGQRFTKNIMETFNNLLIGAPDEKEKIVRVVHLWQKNGVFSLDIINSLLQLEAGSSLQQMATSSATVPAAAPVLASPVASQPAGKLQSTGSASSASASVNNMTVTDMIPPADPTLNALAAQLSSGGFQGADLLSAVVKLLQGQTMPPSLSEPVHQPSLSQQPSAPAELISPGSYPAPFQSSAPVHPLPQAQSMALSVHNIGVQPSDPAQSNVSAQFLNQQTGQLPGLSDSRTNQMLPGLGQMPNESLHDPAMPVPPVYNSMVTAGSAPPHKTAQWPHVKEQSFNKKLLDFDYGESDEENDQQKTWKQQHLPQPPVQPEKFGGHQSLYAQQKYSDDDGELAVDNPFARVDKAAEGLNSLSALPPRPVGPTSHHQTETSNDFDSGPGLWITNDSAIGGRDNRSRQYNIDERPFHGDHRSHFDDRLASGDVNNSRWKNQAQHEVTYGGEGQFGDQDVIITDRERGRDRWQTDYNGQQQRDREHDRGRSDRSRNGGDRSQSRRHRSPERRSRSPRSRRHDESSRHSRERRRRSHSRENNSQSRRHRSRSASREKQRERDRRERDRERRMKGLPPFKVEHLIICSRTIWIGHLNKHTTEQELMAELAQIGEVASINLIPPRGCAYVCFVERLSATRALERLKGFKLLGNSLKVAWALSVGVKQSEFKDLWDVDLGATYIPWSRVPDNIKELAEGAFIDDESLPDSVRKAMAEVNNQLPTGGGSSSDAPQPGGEDKKLTTPGELAPGSNESGNKNGPVPSPMFPVPPSGMPGLVPGMPAGHTLRPEMMQNPQPHMPGMMGMPPVPMMPPGMGPPGMMPPPPSMLPPGAPPVPGMPLSGMPPQGPNEMMFGWPGMPPPGMPMPPGVRLPPGMFGMGPPNPGMGFMPPPGPFQRPPFTPNDTNQQQLTKTGSQDSCGEENGSEKSNEVSDGLVKSNADNFESKGDEGKEEGSDFSKGPSSSGPNMPPGPRPSGPWNPRMGGPPPPEMMGNRMPPFGPPGMDPRGFHPHMRGPMGPRGFRGPALHGPGGYAPPEVPRFGGMHGLTPAEGVAQRGPVPFGQREFEGGAGQDDNAFGEEQCEDMEGLGEEQDEFQEDFNETRGGFRGRVYRGRYNTHFSMRGRGGPHGFDGFQAEHVGGDEGDWGGDRRGRGGQRFPRFDGAQRFERPPRFNGPGRFERPPRFDRQQQNFERPPQFERPPHLDGAPRFDNMNRLSGPPRFGGPPGMPRFPPTGGPGFRGGAPFERPPFGLRPSGGPGRFDSIAEQTDNSQTVAGVNRDVDSSKSQSESTDEKLPEVSAPPAEKRARKSRWSSHPDSSEKPENTGDLNAGESVTSESVDQKLDEQKV